MLSSFFYNDTATTEIYTLSLHDALPISTKYLRARTFFHILTSPEQSPSKPSSGPDFPTQNNHRFLVALIHAARTQIHIRSEEHTSELQSRRDLVCRLLLEKKKKKESLNR